MPAVKRTAKKRPAKKRPTKDAFDEQFVETPARARLREKWGAAKLAQVEAEINKGLQQQLEA